MRIELVDGLPPGLDFRSFGGRDPRFGNCLGPLGRVEANTAASEPTLHFDVTDENQLRKVGMSKEHRIDPQVPCGLLVTASEFPLEIAMFEGNRAEAKDDHPGDGAGSSKPGHNITELVMVADVGTPSAANLTALEDAATGSLWRSPQLRVPYDLGDHFEDMAKPGKTSGPRGGSTSTRSNIAGGRNARPTAKPPKRRRSSPVTGRSPGTGPSP